MFLNIYSKIIFPGGLPQTPHFIALRALQGADFKEKSLYKDEAYMDICMKLDCLTFLFNMGSKQIRVFQSTRFLEIDALRRVR